MVWETNNIAIQRSFVPLTFTIYLLLYFFISLSIGQFLVSAFFRLFVSLSVYFLPGLFLCLFVYLYVCFFVSLFLRLFVSSSVCFFVCLSLCLLVCLYLILFSFLQSCVLVVCESLCPFCTFISYSVYRPFYFVFRSVFVSSSTIISKQSFYIQCSSHNCIFCEKKNQTFLQKNAVAICLTVTQFFLKLA
jgi:hypothetical protein